MVVSENTKNTFWLFSDDVDFQRRGDVQYWLPQFLDNEKRVGSFTPLVELVGLKGGATPRGSNYIDEGIPFLRIQNVGDNELVLDDVAHISEKIHNGELKRSQLKGGDVLFTITGRIGSVAVIPDKMQANINQHIVRMRILDNNVILSDYLATYLLTKYARLQHERVAYGTTRIALDYPTLYNLKVYVPEIDIQRRVSDLIVAGNKYKEEAGDEYANAKKILNKVLKVNDKQNPKIALSFWKWSDEIDIVNRIDPEFYSGDIADQDTVSLGDYVDIAIGKTPAFDDYVKSGKRILKFRAVTGNGLDWTNEERGFVKPSVASKKGDSCIKQDDILFGCAAHQAHYIGSKIDIVDFIPSEFSEGVLTVAEVMRIRSKGEVNPYVLLLFLRSEMGYQLIQKQVKGQTSHLYPKDVAQIKIPKQLLALSNSKEGKEIEEKLKSSIKKNRLSVEKLEEAKKFVENLIENK